VYLNIIIYYWNTINILRKFKKVYFSNGKLYNGKKKKKKVRVKKKKKRIKKEKKKKNLKKKFWKKN